jgi:hypothetical protein
MANQESDREDLLREATALVERVELAFDAADGVGENVVAGFRRDGSASFFFGADPVYQFNAAGELRRAYCDGLLYKAVSGRLASLDRLRQRGEVQLVRHDLTDEEQRAFLTAMKSRLECIATLLRAGRFEVAGQVPEQGGAIDRVIAWLERVDSIPIAATPNVGA